MATKYPCTLCPKSFNTGFQLRAHMGGAHHGNKPVDSSPKRRAEAEEFPIINMLYEAKLIRIADTPYGFVEVQHDKLVLRAEAKLGEVIGEARGWNEQDLDLSLKSMLDVGRRTRQHGHES